MSTGDRISINAVGDIMLGDSSKCIGFGLRSAMQKMDPAAIFARVKGVMAGDIVFGNLECVLSDHDNNSLNFKKAQMRGLPSSAHELREAGFKVVEQQRPFSWPDYQITGTVDCKLLLDGEAVPTEIKSCSPYMFDKINAIDDLTRGKYLYLRKYPAQLTLYLLMDNKERGVFLFKNKSNGQYKEIWMNIDYALGEELLKRAECINRHVAASTLPDPMEYDEGVCDKCGYVHICPVFHVGKEVTILDDEELASLLAEYERLKPYAKAYDDVDRILKDKLSERDKVLIADWYLNGKWVEKKAFSVAAGRYWFKKISRMQT